MYQRTQYDTFQANWIFCDHFLSVIDHHHTFGNHRYQEGMQMKFLTFVMYLLTYMNTNLQGHWWKNGDWNYIFNAWDLRLPFPKHF